MKSTNDDDFVMFCIVISIRQRLRDDIIMWKFVRMNHTVQHIYLIQKTYTV